MSSSQTEPSPSNNNSTDFFRQLSRQKETTPPPVQEQSRVKTGLILGALLGLVYGLVTQVINAILLPGVPLALYPFGLVGNMIASVAIWTGIGALVAWPDSAITGAVLGCLCAGAIPVLRILTTQPIASSPYDQAAILSMNLLAIGIFALLCIPIMLLARWAVEVQGELALQPLWSWRRLRASAAALLLLGVITGALTLYSDDQRQAMREVQSLINQVRAASHIEDLPADLQGTGVDELFANAALDYTLEPSVDSKLMGELAAKYDIEYDIQPTIASNGGSPRKATIDIAQTMFSSPVVVVRFANDWMLTCLIGSNKILMWCMTPSAQSK